jgi:hypothetical protein
MHLLLTMPIYFLIVITHLVTILIFLLTKPIIMMLVRILLMIEQILFLIQPNFALLQLLLFYRLKIKIVFTAISEFVLYLHHSSSMVFVFDIFHRPPLCQNSSPKLHLLYVSNILTFVINFLNFKFHVFIRFELIHVDQHRVSFKLLNCH